MFQTKRFDNFIKLNRGFDLPDDKIVSGKYPVVASTSVKAYHNEFKVKAPAVVTGRSGSLGKIQFIDNDCWPLNTTLYVKDFKGNNPKYVYYLLQTMHLEQYNAGAGVPTLNQNHLHSIKLKIHSLPTQERIADILSTYDDLIENNNKRIALLEKAAQELYKEWFVRFRFPGHETTKFVNGLPEGWEVKKVKSLVNRLPFGTLYKSENTLPEGKVIVIDQSQDAYAGFHNDAPSHIASIENPIALFGDHSCKYQLMITPFSLSENVVPYTAKGDMLTVYLYYSLCGLVETSEYKRHWKELMSKKVLVAPHDLQKNFSIFLKDKLLLIESLKEQNFNLAKQRDLLLPRLMSGKLEV
jgi:type I restriction enzyme S subunit